MKIEDIANDYLMSHYGNLISLGEGILEDSTELYRFPLRSNYPIPIYDDLAQSRSIYAMKMEKLGYIYINNKTKKVHREACTPRKEVTSHIREHLDFWMNRGKRIVTGATSSNLANLEQFRQFFMPVQRIVAFIEETGKVQDDDLKGLGRRTTKYQRYIRLIEGLDLLIRTDGGWEPSIAFTRLRKKAINLDSFLRSIIALAIKERYSTLKDAFGLRVIDRTIRLQNIVYFPEIKIERPIVRKSETIGREYTYHYDIALKNFELVADLGSLASVGTVEKHDMLMYSGHDGLLKNMIDEMKNLESFHEMIESKAGVKRETDSSESMIPIVM